MMVTAKNLALNASIANAQADLEHALMEPAVSKNAVLQLPALLLLHTNVSITPAKPIQEIALYHQNALRLHLFFALMEPAPKTRSSAKVSLLALRKLQLDALIWFVPALLLIAKLQLPAHKDTLLAKMVLALLMLLNVNLLPAHLILATDVPMVSVPLMQRPAIEKKPLVHSTNQTNVLMVSVLLISVFARQMLIILLALLVMFSAQMVPAVKKVNAH
jgi:hypothetical protein